jgi:hypothetical protein
MQKIRRIYYNAQQRAIIWERYQQDYSLHAIATFFERVHSRVQTMIIYSNLSILYWLRVIRSQ